MEVKDAIRLLGKEVLEGMGIFNSVRLKVSEAQDIIALLQEQKYFSKPINECSKIKQLEQFKAEFIKSEHSYYMERFMETCIKLFKDKED